MKKCINISFRVSFDSGNQLRVYTYHWKAPPASGKLETMDPEP